MKRKNISNLEDLKKYKGELKLEQKVALREFSHSIGTMRSDLGSYLMKNVALPLGVAGASVYGIKKAIGGDNQDEVSQNKKQYAYQSRNRAASNSEVTALLRKLVTGLMPFLMQQLQQRNNNHQATTMPSPEVHPTTVATHKTN